MRSAASRSASSSSEPAAVSNTLASIHADPGTQVTVSLVAMIDCRATARAVRSSESVWRKLARAWLLAALAPQKAGQDAARDLGALPQRQIAESARAFFEAMATGLPSCVIAIGPSRRMCNRVALAADRNC